jgi:hypothetical protein
MKIFVVAAILSMPILVNAQTPPGMNQGDMQKLQEMMMCMNKVDQTQLKALEKRQQQFEVEIKSLCQNGKRSQAQKRAMSFTKEMMKNPTIAQIKNCGEMAKSIFPDMPFMEKDEKDSNRHVCDSY